MTLSSGAKFRWRQLLASAGMPERFTEYRARFFIPLYRSAAEPVRVPYCTVFRVKRATGNTECEKGSYGSFAPADAIVIMVYRIRTTFHVERE